VSPSRMPSMICLWMFFQMQAFKQKLHVFTSSRSVSKKSSKFSPGCWVRLRKLRHSTDSFMWPSIYFLMAPIMVATFVLSSSLRSRF